MPEAIQYPVDTTTQEFKGLEEQYTDEATKRASAIARRWDYYEGRHEAHLAAQRDGHDDNVIINNVEIVAEKLASFLVGDGVTFDAGNDDEGGDADEAIMQLWQDNRGMILQNDLALAGCVEGHLAVLITPQADDATGVAVEGIPRLTRIKQKHFAAFWDAFDMRRVLWYRLQAGARRTDYVRGLVSQGDKFADHDNAPIWTVVEWRRKTASNAMGAFGRSDGEWILRSVTPWAFPWSPVVDWQNSPSTNDYYGRSDLGSAINLNDALNFVISNLNRIVKHYADPKTVGTGFNASDVIATSVGGLWTINNPDARVYNLEMQSDAGLARWLSEVISSALWQSGGVIDPQTMKDQMGALTNFGLRVLFTDAIKKTDKKRLLYQEGFEAINRYGLELAGIMPPQVINTIWPDVLPQDEKHEAETLGLDFDRKAISLRTYRERRGYNAAREEERLSEEQEASGNPLAGLLSGEGFSNRPFNAGN